MEQFSEMLMNSKSTNLVTKAWPTHFIFTDTFAYIIYSFYFESNLVVDREQEVWLSS